MAEEREPTYEEARDELMQVVAKLESGGVSLADSMALWQRGEQLAASCQRFLDGAREQVARSRSATEDDPAD
ncbi:Exodeoxyribonuclease VII small subunit [Tessaracoccus bendigoensis DSM 12906]|uniref:Exodeoxyribonuclease 7 small subunit n=1 Tax=Tessaracoccus bendigoensis DSM 12906 TaxID=1123357 RepID=A0A1M6LPA3_9ACTN|nr:exodeoxyribonuclease VII small subunit [Tessaracoccus bendigoensis]SHJ73019.1 Exodeoxyribonuclease VII small subunit [Tessaracoccus bendigoensis DSM 12906]